MPVLTFRLLKIITQHPFYESLLSSQPRLPCRIHRPYLTNKLSRKERVAAIVYHYKAMTHFLSDAQFNKLLGDEGITMAQIVAKDDTVYTLNLISTHKLDREGEVSIILRDSNEQFLAEISFTLCCQSGESAFIIGGLQGPNNSDAQEIIQHATKNFHGIFPKRIVLEALLALAQRMNISTVYAVTNSSHVYQSLRYNKKQKLVHADYDSFWAMTGGTQINDMYYEIPAIIPRKKIEEVVSKKRAEYRRRFDLLDSINSQISA